MKRLDGGCWLAAARAGGAAAALFGAGRRRPGCGPRSSRPSAHCWPRCWRPRGAAGDGGWLPAWRRLAGAAACTALTIVAPARLLEQARVLLAPTCGASSRRAGRPTVRGWRSAFNGWCQRASCAPTCRAGAQASRHVDQERNRLAALMSELTQSVVVCNLDGRILLYNNRARCSSARCPTRPAGRRCRADRPGALDLRRVRAQAGGARAGEHPAAHAARRRSPVGAVRHHHPRRPAAARADGAGAHAPPGMGESGTQRIDGFVLMLDNITRDFEAEPRATSCCTAHRRQPRVAGQPAGGGGDAGDPDLDAECASASWAWCATRRRHERRASRPGRTASAQDLKHALAAGGHARRRPGGRGAAAHRAQLPWLRVARRGRRRLWLKVDSFSLLQALAYLAEPAVDEFDPTACTAPARRRAPGAPRPDLVRPGDEHRDGDGWEMDP
jgi:DNA polymerase-3 subunit epsilon